MSMKLYLKCNYDVPVTKKGNNADCKMVKETRNISKGYKEYFKI